MNYLTRGIITASLFALAGISMQTQAVSMQEEVLIDPTRPSDFQGTQTSDQAQVEKEKLKPVLTLQAIKIGQGSRLAVINGQTVKQGEEVATAKLISIQADAVFLDYEGQAIKLSLLPGSVKTPSLK